MNTVIIWDTMGYEHVKFLTVPGDLFHLNRVYIGADGNEEHQDQLDELVHNEDGTYRHHMSDEFPFDAYRPGETRVIVAGQVP